MTHAPCCLVPRTLSLEMTAPELHALPALHCAARCALHSGCLGLDVLESRLHSMQHMSSLSLPKAASDAANIEPKPFTADRLMAVFQAILTNEAIETDVFPDECLQVGPRAP